MKRLSRIKVEYLDSEKVNTPTGAKTEWVKKFDAFAYVKVLTPTELNKYGYTLDDRVSEITVRYSSDRNLKIGGRVVLGGINYRLTKWWIEVTGVQQYITFHAHANTL